MINNQDLLQGKDDEILQMASLKNERSTLKRASIVSLCLAGAHTLWGFQSYGFISHFDSHITLLDNIWPRLLFCVLPFLILHKFLKNKSYSISTRINTYIWVYSIVFFVAACIYVWPIAILKDPNILLYVAGINTAYFCATWVVVSLPTKYIWSAFFSVISLIIFPVAFVASKAPQIVEIAAISDISFAAFLGMSLGYIVHRLHMEVDMLQARHQVLTSMFFEKPMQQAIFEQTRTDKIKKTQEGNAYVFMFDIRDSTKLTRELGDQWSVFVSKWLEDAIGIVRAYNGIFVKSTGDGIVVVFGIGDEDDVDLSDIPNVQSKDRQVNEDRWIKTTIDAFGCVDKVFTRFLTLSQQQFPNQVIRLGCGVDRGKLAWGVRGNKNRLEFDVWGDRVNVAAKIEAYSKKLESEFAPGSSILVLSPYASDYVDELAGFKKIPVAEGGISGAAGVTWVLARGYSQIASANRKGAA